ncbi:MAG: demethoxyubiquinone hydroxylase family protein [bacterium]|nr:demethoxyubiquinone hydroxylase family protein [bacterium]
METPSPFPSKKKRRLPGDLTFSQIRERMLRVDHAGELGAKYIYKGQLAVLKNHSVAPTLQHMLDQEKEHLAYFQGALKKHSMRPSLLSPLWRVAGFAAGAATAALGKEAAMACTVAVEDVIEEHYASQEDFLRAEEKDPELLEKISQFRQEEQEHRETGLDHGAEKAPGYPLLSKMIKLGTRAAIEVAKRI